MKEYILRKLMLAIPTLLGASMLVFVAVRVVPGDPALMMLGDKASGQELERLREELGLNRPLYLQYVRFLVQIAQGDFGVSVRVQDKAINVIFEACPPTLELAFASVLVACLIGITAGIQSAIRQYSVFDNVLMVLVVIGVSMPVFWSGLLLILLFGLYLRWFPVGGALSDSITLNKITGMYVVDSILQGNSGAFWDAIRHLVLPALALGSVSVAIITRMTRSAMLEVLHQDYITTARSKGVSEIVVLVRHALRNALPPVVTVIGLELGYLLSGAVVTETIFARPGLGRLTVDSIRYRDYPVIEGIVLLCVALFICVNFLVDILYAFLDPQIRYG